MQAFQRLHQNLRKIISVTELLFAVSVSFAAPLRCPPFPRSVCSVNVDKELKDTVAWAFIHLSFRVNSLFLSKTLVTCSSVQLCNQLSQCLLLLQRGTRWSHIAASESLIAASYSFIGWFPWHCSLDILAVVWKLFEQHSGYSANYYTSLDINNSHLPLGSSKLAK